VQDKPEHYNFECERPKPRADAVTVTESFFKGGFDL
jgi:hypothetical protein